MRAELVTPEWLEAVNRLAITGQQVSSVVHEVNNILQVIAGQAEVLESLSGISDSVTQGGRTIRAHARRGGALLSDLLAFTQLAPGKVERVDLYDLAERALRMRRYPLSKVRVAIDLVSAGDPHAVTGDPRELLQIVLNLLINAEQTLAGRPDGRVQVRVERRSAAAQVELSVADNGRGVWGGDVTGLFEPHAAALDSGRLGIGLAAAAWLAERQNGTLRYATSPSGGCVFTLAVPAV